MTRRLLGLSLVAGVLAVAASCGGGDAASDEGEGGLSAGGSGGKAGAGGKGGSAGKGGASGSAGSGASSGQGQGGASGQGQGGSSGQGQGGGSGGCSPACVSPKTCSVKGTCIDPGTCAGDGDCPGGKKCDTSSHTCVIGSSCGVTQIMADVVPPNLLVVLDRSCTMNGKLGDSTKWETAVGALQGLVNAYKGKILFGLTLFPDHVDPKCEQAKFLLPPKAGNEATIESLLGAALGASDENHPGNPCVTNGAQTMKQASTEPSLDDKTRKSYFVLVTDGLTQQVCDLTGAPEGTTKIIENLYQQRGVPTYVIGFGSGAIDKDELNSFANAGGVAAVDPVDPSFKYYRAEDAASLNGALDLIAKKSLGCEFKLAQTPPNPKDIHVFFDKKSEVAQDPSHKDGWDYDATTNQVTFSGAACTSLKSGTVTSVDIVLGCPGGTGGTGGTGGSAGSAGAGGSGGASTCSNGLPCDLTHLCPSDPDVGVGFCMNGCCEFK